MFKTALLLLPVAIVAAAPLLTLRDHARRDKIELEQQVAVARAASKAADAAMIEALGEVARQRSTDHQARQAARYSGNASLNGDHERSSRF